MENARRSHVLNIKHLMNNKKVPFITFYVCFSRRLRPQNRNAAAAVNTDLFKTSRFRSRQGKKKVSICDF